MNEARKRKCKVHALGCNQYKLLKKYHFYSCDSSVHTVGGRFGTVLQFKEGEGVKMMQNNSKFMKDYSKIKEHNLEQMVRMMNYGKTNL